MDDFVRNKLIEWRLGDWIDKFKEEDIDEESLYSLEEKDIDNLIPKLGPRARFKKRLKLLKESKQAADSAEVQPQALPSTSDANDREIQRGNRNTKRKKDLQSESIESPPKRRQDADKRSNEEGNTLSKVKNIMELVTERIPKQDHVPLNTFLQKKISDLEKDKRELVGVFGKTGAGKSSLINAVIQEEGLLPSGRVRACTSVMIKVEASVSKYEAHIEFIHSEEWKDEVWSSFNFAVEDEDQVQERDDRDTAEKLSAVYGEEWKNQSKENLMKDKYFRDIPEFLQSRKKIITCDTALELSAKLAKYTKSSSNDKDKQKQYWPLVKCVTVRVPKKDLLQHVTLVDLPGNGDINKSRDQMWKQVVGSCSTVWIVTEVNRGASEPEAWEILESASSLMGPGGECQQIHFILTKSDQIDDQHKLSEAEGRDQILETNMDAKQQVQKEFSTRTRIKKHFDDECLKVFTVSSKEFFEKKFLNPEDTEIPKLQEFLQDLNDSHSETLNYVSGAHGILSLIQGARSGAVAAQTDVCKVLEENLKHELNQVRKSMEKANAAFQQCLNDGVDKSRSSYEKVLDSLLRPTKTGRGFHRTLKCIVVNKGIHKPKKGKEINFNMKLASFLTDSIDKQFKETFPNGAQRGPYYSVIKHFSLDLKKLIEEHKDVELQLIFLKTEEEKVKTQLCKNILEEKKKIYSSLETKIAEKMQDCYKNAAEFRGKDSLGKMREAVKTHVHDSKDTMFEDAKDEMLQQLRCLQESTLKKLEETMQESIVLSLNANSDSLPDVTHELAEVKKYLNELKH